MAVLVSDSGVEVDAELASSMWSRGIGLMGRRGLAEGAGLLIKPCNSVHTWFMRFPIDVVYLDRDMEIIKIAANMKPWRFSMGGRKAKQVLELSGGEAARLGLTVGQRLQGA